MAGSTPETAPETLQDRVTSMTELQQSSPEEYAQELKNLTHQELEALAKSYEEAGKTAEREAVLSASRERLSEAETPVDTALEELSARAEALDSALPQTPAAPAVPESDRLRQDIDRAATQVTGAIGTGYEFVQQSMVKPVAERLKNVFLIGPLLGSLTELTPTQIKNAVQRKWNQFLATADTFGSVGGKGFFGKMLFNVADSARQKLAILDIHDTVEEHRAEKREGETIQLDERLSREQWKTMKDLISKDPAALTAKTAQIIEKRRQAGIKDIRIVCADLLKTDAEMQTQATQERLEGLKKIMMDTQEWKAVGVTSITFDAEETSFSGGSMKIAEGEVDERGVAKPGTRAAALLEAMKEIGINQKIVITRDERDVVTYSWNAPQTLTLPLRTSVTLSSVKTLVAAPQPDRYSRIEIGAHDAIANDEVQLVTKDGGNVLLAERNDSVLQAIAAGKPRIDTAEATPKFKYANGDFTLMPAPVSLRS